MVIESLIHDARYAVRGIRRSPLFAASVAGPIGLGLGILCSAFTITGLLAAAALARASDALIDIMPAFGLGPYAIGAAIATIATISAALVPSLRTSRIDPASALRAE